MNKIVRISLFLLLAGLNTPKLFAQTAPNISYSNPYALKIGTMVTPVISPSNTGGAGAVNGQTSTFAGNGTAGAINSATPLSAEFTNPLGLAQDAQNNIYVADASNNLIRKITPAGAVTTFAGVAGSHGTTNGAGNVARFYNPRALAVDATGNVYVADYSNNMIRKITPAGVVSTVAGSTAAGSTDGQDTSARFNNPTGIAVDVAGNLFVADYLNNKIRKITPGGMVSTYAGTGVSGNSNGTSALTATFHDPYGVAVDGADNVYITDRFNHKIRVVTPNNTIYTLAGAGTAGFLDSTTPLNAKFNTPCGITIDKIGNLYVSDELNQRIRKITPAGAVTTVAGTGVVGSNNAAGDSSTFDNPYAVLADNDGGFVYESGQDNLIRKIAITPYTISPDLPLGLNFDSTNGAIYGTPQTSQSQSTYTVTEYNATGIDTAHVLISIGIPDFITLSNQNYIVSYTPRVAGVADITGVASNSNNPSAEEVSVAYFDDLGRPMQTVQVKASPQGYDIIQPFAYDQFGREAVKYLPYRSTVTPYASYRTTAVSSSDSVFYHTPPSGVHTVAYPQSTTAFEPSPLGRPIEQAYPGAAWQLATSGISGSGHTVKTAYTVNNLIALTDTVNSHIAALYTISAINLATQKRTLAHTTGSAGNYAASQLNITITKDENWTSGRMGTIEEYKDKEDHIVLTRTFNYVVGTANAFQTLSTYYVYDNLGNLCYVLPPLSYADNSTPTQSKLDSVCYQYRYDERNRLTQKKLPGKGWEYIVYNRLNQPVVTQDSLQRAVNQWTVTKYDSQGRVIVTGLWNAGTLKSLAMLQTSIYGGAQWDNRDYTDLVTGYHITSYPVLSKILRINYYDSYNNLPNVPAVYTNPIVYNALPKGLVTATKTTVLNTIGNTTPDMLWSVHYYDDLGRNIESYQQHYLGGNLNPGNYDDVTTTYDFTNEPITVTRQHWNTASTTVPLVTIAINYIYDNMGRKLMTWEQITNGNNVPTPNTMISKIDYNEIGEVWKKHLHSTNWTSWLQDITYVYNERGWMLLDTSNLFAMQLYYNTGTNKSYNGNIMYQWSGTPTNLGNHYTYTYDKLNRLLSGNSSTGYNENSIVYDLEGNITKLHRTRASATVLTDNLAYTYKGNQLQSITDSTTSDLGLKHGSWIYTYDANGNLITDPSKGLTAIKYNLLNLPDTITGTHTLAYVYDAGGKKLRRISTTGNILTNDYVDGIQYDNASGQQALDFIQTEEGRAVPDGSGGYLYNYNLTDHLGNSRVSFDNYNNAVRPLQADNYYAFGTDVPVGAIPTGRNYYLYDKKEIQDELTEYDYGARFYDPVIARWNVVDEMASTYYEYSPYNYVRNNPVLRIDQNGLWDITVHAYKDRAKYGYGIAEVTDRKGKLVFKFSVRLVGTGGRNRNVVNSDTPTGVYDIPDNGTWITDQDQSVGNRKSYGSNPRLNLTPESGEIVTTARGDIRFHGGRQEIYNEATGLWEEDKNPKLKDTHGCMRCFDADVKTLKDITDALEKNDKQEKPGKVTVVDDLIEQDNSKVPYKGKQLDYVTPNNLNQQQIKSLNDAIVGFLVKKYIL